jgi:hypothetical protein
VRSSKLRLSLDTLNWSAVSVRAAALLPKELLFIPLPRQGPTPPLTRALWSYTAARGTLPQLRSKNKAIRHSLPLEAGRHQGLIKKHAAKQAAAARRWLAPLKPTALVFRPVVRLAQNPNQTLLVVCSPEGAKAQHEEEGRVGRAARLRKAPIINGWVFPPFFGGECLLIPMRVATFQCACPHRAGTRAGCEWLRFLLPQMPRPLVNGTSSLVAGAHFGSSFVVSTHRTFGSASPAIPRDCAPCRTSQIRSGNFSHPSRGVATFSSPSPSVTPATFDRFEIVWRGAALCSVVR